MTLFIDLRATPSGGICAAEPSLWEDGTRLLSTDAFESRVQGLDVLLATHGFNVDREDGVRALSTWSSLCRLPGAAVFVGVLWPGDSRYLPVIDYPFEGDEAIASGRLLAAFLNRRCAGAASLSFASHSLGARTVLEALRNLERKARRLILMAGAIENDCLVREYATASQNVQEICVLSSRSDWVLKAAFPIGNPVGEILMHGHPYFKTAIGRSGPAQPIPLEQQGGAWKIPDGWDYGHGDYLPKGDATVEVRPPVAAPGPSDGIPVNPPVDGWKSAWSAGAVSTEFL
ncbi:MAG TPA: alpha/beta hydrolase [Burkholderiales bacterium]|jgi:hypothetical protein